MKKINLIVLLFSVCFICNSILAQDWAQLNRYEDANIIFKAKMKGEATVVFMGNSITEVWVSMRPDFFEENPYVGRGISGQTTPQMLLRFRQDVIDLNPAAVVILAGTNDIAGNTGPMTLEEILDNIKSMTELAEANGIKVILCSVLPAFDYPWRPGLKPNEKIPALNSLIKDYAASKGIVYLDYFSAMADERNGLPKELAEDEVHPTEAGYEMMEPLAKEAIQQALNSQ